MSERCRSVDFKQQTNEPAADTLRMTRSAGIDSPVRSNVPIGKNLGHVVTDPTQGLPEFTSMYLKQP